MKHWAHPNLFYYVWLPLHDGSSPRTVTLFWIFGASLSESLGYPEAISSHLGIILSHLGGILDQLIVQAGIFPF
jgi:hypothetical protein